MSSCLPPDNVTLSLTLLPVFLTFSALAPVSTRIPCFLKVFSSSFEISSSSTGTMRGNISSTVTFVPKRLKIEANSTPTAPAPMIPIVFGIVVRFRISTFVRMNCGSGSSPGSMRASDPVAIMMFFASCVCVLPSAALTSTFPPPFKVA